MTSVAASAERVKVRILEIVEIDMCGRSWVENLGVRRLLVEVR